MDVDAADDDEEEEEEEKTKKKKEKEEKEDVIGDRESSAGVAAPRNFHAVVARVRWRKKLDAVGRERLLLSLFFSSTERAFKPRYQYTFPNALRSLTLSLLLSFSPAASECNVTADPRYRISPCDSCAPTTTTTTITITITTTTMMMMSLGARRTDPSRSRTARDNPSGRGRAFAR